MKFLAPETDPGFPTHGAHGVEAQMPTIRTALSFCRLHRTAVDVGAHIGLWTNELANRFDTVLAFEPDLKNFHCLAENIGTRAALFRVALGAVPGVCDVALPPGGNSGMWRIVYGATTVMHPLDEYNLSEVDFIKIDTEGYEGQVLLGARETLANCRPVVLFEDNGLGPKYFGADWVNPKPILASLGYKCAVRIRKDEIWTPA